MEPPCPILSDLQWGSVSADYNSTVGLFVAKYICDEGFVTNGDYLRYCLEDGKWTGQEPFCLQGEDITLYSTASHNVIFYVCS